MSQTLSAVLLLLLSPLGGASGESSFNSYAAHLNPRVLDAKCLLDSPSYFRNLTYVFRAEVYPREQPIALRDGRFEDPGPFDEGVIDWTIELEAQTGIRLGDERAVILTFFANHEGGSGSASHILVVRCADGRLQIVFEAGGEGVRVSLAGTDALLVSHPIWRASDSHAAPSRIVDEQYSWRAGPGRFVLAGRYERASGIR